MADQADFPDIYIDSSVGAGGVGSEADPYSAFSEINWTTGGDNSVFDYYAGTPAASVTINLQKGEVWRDQPFVTGCNGTATYPIIIQGYGAGDNPMLDGSIDVSTASYKWTASGSGTNEYYLEASGGGTPGISEPEQALIDSVRCGDNDKTIPALGSLTDHSFAWGDNDTLGYSTVYIRDDSGNPDVTGAVIDVSNGARSYIFYLQHAYITVDGVDTRYSNGHGYRFVGGANGHHCVVKNCLAFYNEGGVGAYEGANDCEINNVEIDGSIGGSIGAGGSYTEPVSRLLITGCEVHDAWWTWTGYWEASGIKTFAINDCTITKSKWYNNPGGGIRLDGLSAIDIRGGANYCTVSENELYNNGYNQMEIEFSANNTIKHNYFHDPAGGVSNFTISKLISGGNKVFGNVSADATNEHGFRTRTLAGTGGSNIFANNTAYNCKMSYSASSPNAVFKNNISVGSITADLFFTDDQQDTVTSDYNCFSGDGFTTVYDGKSFTTYTLAEWEEYSDGIGNPCDSNSIETDPLLSDAASDDYTLASNSPCIGAGENIGAPYNEALMPTSTWPSGVVTGDQNDY